MSTCNWLGAAAEVAQVDSLTPGGTIEAGDVFIVTLTGEDGRTATVSYAATGTSVASVCTGLAAALEADTDPLFTAIAWTDQTTYVKATASTAGVPFYCAASTTETGGGAADDQTFTRAAVTANSGPNDWNCVDNWNAGAKPVNSDTVNIENVSSSILYGLDQSGVALAVLRIPMTFTGYIGTTTADLKIGCTTCTIGESFGTGKPTGSGLIAINFGTSNVAVTVIDSRSLSVDGVLPSVRLRIHHASATLAVRKGSVLLGWDSAASTGDQEVSSVTVGDALAASVTADVVVSKGVTVATHTNNGGNAVLNNAPTTLNWHGGSVDLTQDATARTITTANCTAKGNSKIRYDSAVITFTTFNRPAGIVELSIKVL
jgi:hypothetical protein